MAKICFKPMRFNQEASALINICNEVIEEYQAQDIRLTLRQLYYQMIGRDLFPESWIDVEYNAKEGLQPDTKNTVKNYKRLGVLLSDARIAGRVDWDAIEDRVRQPTIWQDFEGLADLTDQAARSYRLPRWDDQKKYVELWVEKDALASVLEPLANMYHCPLVINRGYSSSSAMYESACRLLTEMNTAESRFYDEDRPEREGVVLYLGDHDPSGMDMVRDIRDRLDLFGCAEANYKVEKIALHISQVRELRLPSNPAKLTDSRAKKYIAEFGRSSWEVDAIRPEVMQRLIERAIQKHLDIPKYNAVIAQEKADKEKLKKAVAELVEAETGDEEDDEGNDE